MSNINIIFDVIILGFGVSGISLSAQCETQKLNYIVLERNQDLGGVWLETTKDTKLQTNKKFYEFSDFPFPKNTKDHPDKNTILTYLKNYLEFKGVSINKRVKWCNKVDSVYQKKNLWHIKTNNSYYYTKNIGVCLGCFSQPKPININNISKNMNYYQFNYLKNSLLSEQFLDIFKKKRILVHGNGPTACDIIDILDKNKNIDLTVSVKKDKFYINKYLCGISTSNLVNPFILSLVKYFPPGLFFLLFSILEMIFFIFKKRPNKTFIPYSKMNSKNVVAKNSLNKDAVKLAHYLGEWEENLYDINIWATGSSSGVLNLFPEYDNKNYLFIYNSKYKNCGFIGLAPSYNWLKVSEAQSKIFVKNIVTNYYPNKNIINNWIKKRESYCKKIKIDFWDLTYDGLGFDKYLM